MNRREFFRLASMVGLSTSAMGFGQLGRAETYSTTTTVVPTNVGVKGRVVVIGGGMAGATVAKYLRLWGGTGVQVTLVERDSAYVSNILSNLVLTGQRTLSSLNYSWSTLASKYGVKVVKGDVLAIDPSTKSVRLANGTSLPYDRLVIAPGVEFDDMPGLAPGQTKIVHAWKAGPQTTTLRNQIVAMPNGGTFVLTIPAKPYRCPPGPYERACVVADWLKRNRPGSKVVVLDANPGITAEVHSFTQAFEVVHAGVIDYHPGVVISNVDASTMTVSTNIGNVKGHVINAIPPHRAGKVITANGLANAGGRWAGVDVRSYEHTAAPGIHVIGDASATTQPKAGHIANQEAKICADAIVRLLGGGSADPSPVTNSACYSPITFETASWLTAVFGYDATNGQMAAIPAGSGEAGSINKDNYEQMFKWFNTLMSDTFA